MQFNQTEIKDLTAVITMTVEPADYQEAVQKELINIRMYILYHIFCRKKSGVCR